MNKILVFFDAKCNVCSKEISYYSKIDHEKKFKWINVNEGKNELKKYKIKFTDSLMYLHVIDKNKNIKVGVDAFIIIWQELKYWKFLAYLININFIKKITSFFYKIWARKRFEKLDYKCDL